MKFFGYQISKPTEELRSVFNNTDESVSFNNTTFNLGGNYTRKNLTLSTVYRAVNLISDSIASLQLKLYKVDNEDFKTEFREHTLFNIVGIQPNYILSRFDFFKIIITSMLLNGSAFIFINRNDKFEVESLEILNPDCVWPIKNNNEIKYKVKDVKGYLNSADIIHIMNFPEYNSISKLYEGRSTIYYAINSLSISHASEKHSSSWFEDGASNNTLLHTTQRLETKQKNDILNGLKNNGNGVNILSGIPDLNSINMSVTPKDSQLLETRSYNALDICRFFSIDPILLFVNSGSYANAEQAQLQYLNTTLLPIIEKIENAFEIKLILPSFRSSLKLAFDLANLLRVDTNSAATYYKTLFELGVVSANDIAKYLNLPKITGENGSEHFISTNLQKINNMIVDQKNSIDNKIL